MSPYADISTGLTYTNYKQPNKNHRYNKWNMLSHKTQDLRKTGLFKTEGKTLLALYYKVINIQNNGMNNNLDFNLMNTLNTDINQRKRDSSSD